MGHYRLNRKERWIPRSLSAILDGYAICLWRIASPPPSDKHPNLAHPHFPGSRDSDAAGAEMPPATRRLRPQRSRGCDTRWRTPFARIVPRVPLSDLLGFAACKHLESAARAIQPRIPSGQRRSTPSRNNDGVSHRFITDDFRARPSVACDVSVIRAIIRHASGHLQHALIPSRGPPVRLDWPRIPSGPGQRPLEWLANLRSPATTRPPSKRSAAPAEIPPYVFAYGCGPSSRAANSRRSAASTSSSRSKSKSTHTPASGPAPEPWPHTCIAA